MMIGPTHPLYRFVVLIFTSLMTFGSYFCFDMPSVLQSQFTGNLSCAMLNISDKSPWNDSSCCSDCLGMSPDEYNLLYAIYAWTNAVVVIGAGFFIDKLGNTAGLFLFSLLCLLGSSVFSVGAMVRGTSAMLPLMLAGRLLFGSGNGSLTGAVLCGLGFISSVITSVLDRYGTRELGQDANMKYESKKVHCSDVKHFGQRYWILTFALMFFYSGVFPFVADASKFIQDKYDYSKQTSAYFSGSIYDVSMLLTPFLGFVVDQIGLRGYISLLCAVSTIPVYAMLAFTYVHPLVSTILLGITYSVAAPSLWPSIPLVVSPATVGTATGIVSSLQMVGVGLSNVIVGQILGDQESLPEEQTLLRWKYVMIFLLGNTLLCAIFSAVLIIVDKRMGGMLNQNKRQRLSQAALEAAHIEGQQPSSSGCSSDDTEASETDPLLYRRPGSRASINYTA